jgi:acetolactate synthase-1/3 small subunit
VIHAWHAEAPLNLIVRVRDVLLSISPEPAHHVGKDLTAEGPAVQRELALFKVAGKGESRIEALRLAEIFRANVVDSTLESFVFEITGTPEKIDAFGDLMRPLGLREMARTGVAALSRGA